MALVSEEDVVLWMWICVYVFQDIRGALVTNLARSSAVKSQCTLPRRSEVEHASSVQNESSWHGMTWHSIA